MMVVVVMGVAGCGKSTVGPLLAKALGGDFAEGDKFHPPENVAKMSRGEPLGDADRAPWLAAMAASIREWRTKDRPTVLACSALKQSYRNLLAVDPQQVHFVYLKGHYDLIWERMLLRQGHYMKASMLQSQFATLEEPADAFTVDISQTPPQIVDAILAHLASGTGLPS